jgi:uncharacterized membrane protein YGL010W
MKTIQTWLEEYHQSHQNRLNQRIHTICVPLIFASVVGALWSLPTPFFPFQHQYFNWATIGLVPTLAFYWRLSRAYFLAVFLCLVPMLGLVIWLEKENCLWQVSALVFVLAWIGQFIGHHIEGRRPSFLQDLKFLLIGPLWTISPLMKKLGIGG